MESAVSFIYIDSVGGIFISYSIPNGYVYFAGNVARGFDEYVHISAVWNYSVMDYSYVNA